MDQNGAKNGVYISYSCYKTEFFKQIYSIYVFTIITPYIHQVFHSLLLICCRMAVYTLRIAPLGQSTLCKEADLSLSFSLYGL